MSNTSTPPDASALTPCIGTCRLGTDGTCIGCRRTGDEIGRWCTMSDTERLYVMQVVLPGRRLS